jgi:outer membrane receptor protein involved in Fe transport
MIAKKLLIVTLLIFLGKCGISQNHIITGKITSQGEPLESATVTLARTHLGAMTATNGDYRLTNVPGDSCQISVSRIGYLPRYISFIASGKTTVINVELEKGVESLNQVVVTGVSKATLIRENPLAMETVSNRQIEQTSADNVIDAIAAHAPGFEAVKTGPNVSKPFINGLGYNRVLTLYDGLRVETQQWGDEHGVPLDDYIIERAEIIKGPASLMYGSDAIAGVLSLFPAIPHEKDGVLHTHFLSEYQTNNGLIGNSLMLSKRGNHWSWALRGSERIARSYSNPIDGRVYLTGFKMANASGFLGYNTDKGYSHLNFTYYDNRQGIPDGSRDSLTRKFTCQVFESQGANTVQQQVDNIKSRPVVSESDLNSYTLSPLSQHIQDYRLYTDHSYKLGQGDIKASLGAEENRRREFDHPTDPGRPGEYIILKTLDYGLRYNVPSFANIEPSFGLNGMYQNNSNDQTATDYPIPNYNLFDVGVYGYGKWKLNKWTVAGGIRYDHRSEKGDGMYSRPDPVTGFYQQVPASDSSGALHPFSPFLLHFQGISGSVGATYQISDQVSMKANLARGYRSPNITEIASNGLDPGAHIYYIGNLHFVPEFSLQEDFGICGEFRDLSFGFNAFSNYIENYIYEDQAVNANGNPMVIFAGNKTFQFQQTNAQLYGGDLEIGIHPESWTGFRLDNAFSCVYGINLNPKYDKTGSQGEYLPFIPPPRLLSSASYTLTYNRKMIQTIIFKVEMEYNWEQNRYLGLYNTETPTAGYCLLNSSVHVDLNQKTDRKLQVQLQINNLLNTAYQNHLSRLQYFEYYISSPSGHRGIYDMGRNLCLRIIWDII